MEGTQISHLTVFIPLTYSNLQKHFYLWPNMDGTKGRRSFYFPTEERQCMEAGIYFMVSLTIRNRKCWWGTVNDGGHYDDHWTSLYNHEQKERINCIIYEILAEIELIKPDVCEKMLLEITCIAFLIGVDVIACQLSEGYGWKCQKYGTWNQASNGFYDRPAAK